MSVDESGAPWPYEAAQAGHADEEEPTWECPDDTCQCHAPEGETERVDHTIVLFDHEAKRMGGARCRVLENGQLANKDAPFADGGGKVPVKLRPGTRTLMLEWAPADVPEGPRFPFRKLYHLNLGEKQDEGVERRLHNLGFVSHTTLEENISDFQRTYGKKVTGKVADVEADLIAYHDAAALPPVPEGSGTSAAPSGPKPPPGDDTAKLDTVSKLRDDGENPSSVKAKAPADQGSGAPGAAPGPAAQGSAAAIQTSRVRIELHRAFALREEDFATTDDFDATGGEWQGQPYEIKKLLDEVYSTPNRRTWRLGPRGSQPVRGAKLIQVLEGVLTGESGQDGSVVFDIRVPAKDKTAFAFRVEPADGQLNESDEAAGPALTEKDTNADFLYRPFTVFFSLGPDGALVDDTVVVLPEQKPRFVKVIEAKKRVKKGDNVILIDWRPDWMISGKTKRNKSRLFDTRDTPINPFDNAHSKEDRLKKAPPGIVIHQTGTHNLSFLPGFIADGNVTSIHYVIDYDGFVIKTLDEFYRANHGGGSVWETKVSVNQFTVGFETMHTDTTPLAPGKGESFRMTPRRFTKEQYDAIIRVCQELRATYPIFRRRLFGHMEVLVQGATEKGGSETENKGQPASVTDGTLSRDRVGCPGPVFEWQRLEEAKVSLARVPLPAAAPGTDPDVAAVFAAVPKLQAITEIKAGSKSPEAKMVKQLLFDIGYSVSKNPTARAQLTEEYDAPAREAVRAFQTHHFSGRRQAYSVFGRASATAPAAGTLDQKTILAILEYWFAAISSTD